MVANSVRANQLGFRIVVVRVVRTNELAVEFLQVSSVVDIAVAVEVFILNVARTEHKVAALEVVLINSIRVFQLVNLLCALCAFGNFLATISPSSYEVAIAIVNEVVLLIEAVNFVTPDFAVGLAVIPAVYTLAAAVFCNRGLSVTDGECGVHAKAAAEAVVEVKCKFPTASAEVTKVALRSARTK